MGLMDEFRDMTMMRCSSLLQQMVLAGPDTGAAGIMGAIRTL